MAYVSNENLPRELREILPAQAQTIYRETYNTEFELYEDKNRADQMAWNAIRKEYEPQKNGSWIRKKGV